MNELIGAYIDAYNKMDLKKMLEVLTEDIIFEKVNNNGKTLLIQGKLEFGIIAAKSLKMVSKREQKICNIILNENAAAVEIDYSATLAMDIHGAGRAGEHLKLRGATIFKFSSGLISGITDYS